MHYRVHSHGRRREDVDFYVAEARQALADLGATIREVDIASADAATVAAAIDAADCIYVSGGHTFYLLKQLRDSGAGSLIVKAVRQGTTYIGESAGSAVAADDCAYIRPLEDPESLIFIHDGFCRFEPHHDKGAAAQA